MKEKLKLELLANDYVVQINQLMIEIEQLESTTNLTVTEAVRYERDQQNQNAEIVIASLRQASMDL